MHSFGALNGSAMNEGAVNGGTFRLLFNGTCTVSPLATVTARRRRRGAAAVGVGLGPTLAQTRRHVAGGSLIAAVAVSAAICRRRRGEGIAAVGMAATAALRARRGAYGSASLIAISAAANFSWHFLHRAPMERSFALTGSARHFTVPADLRVAQLVTTSGPIAVPRDREAS